MGVFEQFPYTNFHEVNDDWFIGEFKKLLDAWVAQREEFADLNSAWVNLETFVNDYFNNLDVTDEINNKLEDMRVNGILAALITPIIAGDSKPIVVTATSAMTDHTKIYALSSNMHLYFYDSSTNNFRDSNIVYGNDLTIYEYVENLLKDNADIPVAWEQGQWNSQTWAPSTNANYIRVNADIYTKGLKTITVTITGTTKQCAIYWQYENSDGTRGVENHTANTWTFTVNDAVKSRFSVRFSPQEAIYPEFGYNIDISGMGVVSDLILSGYNRALTYVGNVDTTTPVDNLSRGIYYISSATANAVNEGGEYIHNLPFRAYSLLVVFDTNTIARRVQYLTNDKNELWTRTHGSTSGVWSAWEKVARNYDYTQFFTFASFTDFGVIGDSLASGHIYTNPEAGTGWKEAYPQSWPQVVARLNGQTAYNFSYHGVSVAKADSTSGIWDANTSYGGKPSLNDAPALPLYIIALGANDSDTNNIGTISDIDNTSATTFYGKYGAIIRAVKAHAPNALIVLCTPNAHIIRVNLTEAVKAIGTAKHLPVINWLDDLYIQSDFNTEGAIINNHPSVMGYGAMAMAFNRLIDKCIRDNIGYFNGYDIVCPGYRP